MLVRCGFLDFAGSRTGHLFPSLRADK